MKKQQFDHHGRLFKPFISPTSSPPELSFRAVSLGLFLGLVFGVGYTYIGLYVGATASASVVAAALSMAILRSSRKRVSILENNMVQTIASVGEGIAGPLIFTVPALFILGQKLDLWTIFVLALLGAMIGILFMIPMRRHIIVEEHGKIPFPEGFACSELLKSGQSDKSKGRLIIIGALSGVVYKICTSVLFLWKETPNWFISFYQNAHISINCSPALLAAGFIVGPRTAFHLFVGGGFSWWVLNPLIQLFGQGGFIVTPADIPISQMTSDDIWFNYIRYIGVGAVGMAGCLSLIKISRVITRAFKRGLDEIFHEAIIPAHLKRTDFDLPMKWLIFGAIFLILVLWLYPAFSMNFFMIMMFVILGFFFVGLSALSAGFVGTSSNPTSGMTITFLLIVFLFFMLQGWTDRAYIISALILSIVTSVAIGMAATTAQDLNTGFLLGATPRKQQVGEMMGIVFPSLAIAGTITLFGSVYTFGSNTLPAPQATMIALITRGVMEGGIPWILLAIGAVVTTLAFLIKLPVMPLALGLYLPISLSSPFIVGGAVAGLVKHYSKSIDPIIRGDVLCSGLVAGDACIGVLIAFLTALGVFKEEGTTLLGDTPSFVLFLALGAAVYWLSMKTPKRKSP